MNHVSTSLHLRAAALMLLALCTAFALSYANWSRVTHAQDASDEGESVDSEEEESDEEKIEYAPHPTELVDLTIKVDIHPGVLKYYGLSDATPQPSNEETEEDDYDDPLPGEEEYEDNFEDPDWHDEYKSYGIQVVLWNEEDSRRFFMPLYQKTLTVPMYMMKYHWNARLMENQSRMSFWLKPLQGELEMGDEADELKLEWRRGACRKKSVEVCLGEEGEGDVIVAEELMEYGHVSFGMYMSSGDGFSLSFEGPPDTEDQFLVPDFTMQLRARLSISDKYGWVEFERDCTYEGDSEDDIEVYLGQHRVLQANYVLSNQAPTASEYLFTEFSYEWVCFDREKDPGMTGAKEFFHGGWQVRDNMPALQQGSTRAIFAPLDSIIYVIAMSEELAPQVFRYDSSSCHSEIVVPLSKYREIKHVKVRLDATKLLSDVDTEGDMPESHDIELIAHIARDGPSYDRFTNTVEPELSEPVVREDKVIEWELRVGNLDRYRLLLTDGKRANYRRFVLQPPKEFDGDNAPTELLLEPLESPDIPEGSIPWNGRFKCGQSLLDLSFQRYPEPFWNPWYSSYWPNALREQRSDHPRPDVPEYIEAYGSRFEIPFFDEGDDSSLNLSVRIRFSGSITTNSPRLAIVPGDHSGTSWLSHPELKALSPIRVFSGLRYSEFPEKVEELCAWCPEGKASVLLDGWFCMVIEVKSDQILELDFGNIESILEAKKEAERRNASVKPTFPEWVYESENPQPASYDVDCIDRQLLPGQREGHRNIYIGSRVPDSAVARGEHALDLLDSWSFGVVKDSKTSFIRVASDYNSGAKVLGDWVSAGGEEVLIRYVNPIRQHFERIVEFPVSGREVFEPYYFTYWMVPYSLNETLRTWDQREILGMKSGYTVMPYSNDDWVFDGDRIRIYEFPTGGDWVILPIYKDLKLNPVLVKAGATEASQPIDLITLPSAKLSSCWLTEWVDKNGTCYGGGLVKLRPKGLGTPFIVAEYFFHGWGEERKAHLAPGTWEAALFLDAVRDPIVVTFEVTKDTKVVPFPEEFKKWFPEIDAAKEKSGEEEGD